MLQPLISILIPFKNSEDYIIDCLDSILNQNYKNWEAIFIDDNSSDSTFNIIEDYKTKDDRIKLYKNKGVGIIEALRTAFGMSKGRYITRMDSDDMMTAIRLEVMVNSLIKCGKTHLALGQVKYFREGGLNDGYSRYERWLNTLTKTGNNYSEIYKECVIPSPCWMLHRDDLKACGGFEPNRYPEDYDLAFRCYREGFTCIPSEDVLLLWRDYETRTSRTHENYAQNYFLDLKVHYFLELEYDNKRPLTVWGAGAKGKSVAKLLIKKNIPFYWICDNPKKIGKDIYNQKLLNFEYLEQLKQPQSIVTVANTEAQNEIKRYFKLQEMRSMIDYFFFC